MTTDKLIKNDLPAFAVFAEMMELTVSDIARGMIDGHCTPEGMMQPPAYLIVEKAAAEYVAAREGLHWVRTESFRILCDSMGLHPEEMLKEARRRYRTGSAMRDGSIRPRSVRDKGGVAGTLVLAKLREVGPQSTQDLARSLGISRECVVRRLSWLVSQGLVDQSKGRRLSGKYWSPMWRALGGRE